MRYNSTVLSRILTATATAAVLASLAACGNSTTAPPLEPTVLPAPGGTSASPTAAAAPDVDGCSASGYPSTSIVLKHQRDMALFIANTNGMSDPGAASFGPVTAARSATPFVRLDGPGMLTAQDRESLLDSAGVTWSSDGVLEKSARVKTPLGVGNGHNWVVYMPVRFLTGTFTLRRCGVPYNEGTSWMTMHGTYGTYEMPSREALAVQCGAKPKNAVAAMAQKGPCSS